MTRAARMTMKDENCIFCKLANGDIPTRKIYEDDQFSVIMDASPATKGHALILPKDHYANIYEIPEETVAAAMVLAKKIATKMTDALHCDGFNILQNNGEAAGQTVMHFHVHLIPRYKNDTVDVKWAQGTLTEDDKKEILGLF